MCYSQPLSLLSEWAVAFSLNESHPVWVSEYSTRRVGEGMNIKSPRNFTLKE